MGGSLRRCRLPFGVLLVACGPDPAFRCESDAMCGPSGRCEPIGFCSFPDTRCPSARRFAEHADAQVAGSCVAEVDDAGSDATSDPAGSTTAPATDGGSTRGDGDTASMPVSDGDASTSSGGGSEDDTSGLSRTLADGLLVHLPLDDDFLADSGAIDVSGNDLHASCTACPESVRGRVGAAAGFSSDAVLTIADHPLLRPDDGLSVSVWVLDADPVGADTQLVVGKVVTGLYNSFQISTSPDAMLPTDRMVFRLTEAGPLHHALFLPNPFEADAWHHLAAVWTGSSAQVWVDGTMLDEIAAAPVLWYDAGPFTIGADDNDGLVYFFRGAIDEVRLYDRPLTAAEIGELAAQR